MFMIPAKSQDKTQFLLHEIPQTISLNPAINYDCRNYIELPVISQLQLYYRNSGFSHKQAFEKTLGENDDTLRLDIENFSKALGNRNHIRVGGKINILGIGIEKYDWFFSFNISNRSAARLSFNRNVVDARDGNWDFANDIPRDIDINGTGLHLINYTEFAFGASYMIYPGLSAGARAKYLLGTAHLQTRRSDMQILTSENPIEITGISNVLIRGSLPVTIGEDSSGYVSGIESNFHSASELPDFLFAGNHGFAIDAGVIYDYSEKWVFSASILDLGFIRWRKNINVLSQKEDFIFEGVDLNNYIKYGTDTDFLQALEDSIYYNFRLAGSNEAYTAMIPLRILAGAEYKWRKNLHLGAAMEGEILSSRFYPSLTLTAIARPTEYFTASLSYSLMDRGFSNIGLGIVLGNKPVQFYMVTDNIPVTYVHETDYGLYWPYSSRTMNIRAGLNIILGCNKNKMNSRKWRWRNSCPAYD